MKQLVGFLIFASLLVGHSYGQSVSIVESAEDAYLNRDFATAIVLYESIIDGNMDVALYYNLGLSYEQQGSLAPALLNYLRGLRLAPRDEDIRLAIARVRGYRQDVISDEVDWLFITANSTNTLTLMELSLIGLGFWSVFWVIVAVMRRWYPKRSFIVFGLALLMLGFMVILGSRWVVALYPVGVVMDDTSMIMSGAGDDYLPLYALHEGAEFYVMEYDAGWTRFRLADGRTGWINNNDYAMVEHE